MAVGVFDTSVVLMILNKERGASENPQLLKGGLISTVNLAEVYTKFDEWGVSDADAQAMLDDLPTVSVELDAPLAKRAGRLRRLTRKQGLSLGDRVCLAVAERESLPVYTADKKWAELDLGIDIRLVR